MKHWFDLTDAERVAMSEEEQKACISASIRLDAEILELIQCGAWARHHDQMVYKLPLCHDFGVEP
jgi:hypothetical protein